MRKKTVLIHTDLRTFPIIEKLCHIDDIRVVLFGDYGQEQLQKKGLPFHNLSDFQTADVKHKTDRALQMANERLLGFEDDNLWQPFTDILQNQPEVKQELKGFLQDYMVNAIAISEVFAALHQQHPIHLVVVLEDWAGLVSVPVLCAKTHGITSLLVKHGTPGLSTTYKPSADHCAVFGEYEKDFLPKHYQIKPEQIHVTGNPAWDHYALLAKSIAKKKNIKNADTQPHRSQALFLSSWEADAKNTGVENNLRCFLQAVVACRKHYTIDVAIKIHPYGNIDVNWHQAICRDEGVHNAIVSAQDLDGFLAKSDFVIAANFTSTLIQAALLSSPGAFIRPAACTASDTYARDCDCYIKVFDTPGAVTEVLKDFCARGPLFQRLYNNIANTVRWFSGANDGQSALRVATLIKQLVDQSAPQESEAQESENQALVRILMVGLNQEYGGGVVGVGRDLSRGLTALGYEVVMLEPQGNLDGATKATHIDGSSRDGYTLMTASGWPIRLTSVREHLYFELGNQFISEILDHSYINLVHIHHTITYGSDIIRVAHEHGCKVVVTLHDFWMFCALIQRLTPQFKICGGPGDGRRCKPCVESRYQGTEGEWAARIKGNVDVLNRYADVIIVVSNDLREFAIGQGIDGAKIIIQHPSVFSIDTIWKSAQQLPRPLHAGKLTLAYVGNMLATKGAHILLEAIKELDKQTRQAVSVVIHGDGDPDYKENLENIAKHIVGANIKIMGPYNAKQDLLNIFNSIDVVVIPSIWPETFGMVVEEAMAARVPVICSRIGGLQEHFFDGVQGRMFPAGDVKALAAIIRELTNSPLLLAAWQRNIREPRLCEAFVIGTDNLYRQILGLAPAQLTNKAVLADTLVDDNEKTTTIKPNLAYRNWLKHQTLTDADTAIMAERMTLTWKQFPSIHVILVLRPGLEALLADTLDSLGNQLYKGWGFSVIANSPSPAPVFAELDMLEWLQVDGDPYIHVNPLIQQSSSEWVTLIEAGDRFPPQAFFTCIDYINLHPEWQFIYTDEDRIDDSGNRCDPQFKPDFNLDLLRSLPYIGNFCLISRPRLIELGGYSNLCPESSANYDVALQLLDRHTEIAIGHIPQLLFHRLQAMVLALSSNNLHAAQLAALNRHLERNGVNAQATAGLLPGSYFVDYPCTNKPLVSIIIPTRDKLEMLEACLDSIDKTDYPHIEIIVVDNNSRDEATSAYLQKRTCEHRDFHVISYAKPFNFSAINNLAAKQAQGEFLLFLNNDTQVMQKEWLQRMLSNAQRPEIGIVGARLIGPGETIQHAGVILGIGDSAQFVHFGLPMQEPGFMGRAQVAQNFSAVTAACLMINKSLYWQVGGMDAANFSMLYGDIDLCLKVAALNYKIVWLPSVVLLHFGGQTIADEINKQKQAKRFNETVYRQARINESQAFLERWLKDMANDPAYNQNLTLTSNTMSTEDWIDVKWDTHFHDRPHILGISTDTSGCALWRIGIPLGSLDKAALIQSKFLPHEEHDNSPGRTPLVTEIARIKPDTVYLQAFVHDANINMLTLYKKYTDAFLVYTLDDNFFSLPEKNPESAKLYRDIKKRIKKALSFCDRLIVTTQPLKDVYAPYAKETVIIPNYLEKARWQNVKSTRRQGDKPRVGWAGAMQHHGDLELMIPVIEATKDEIDWIFFGMYLKEFRQLLAEFYGPVPFDQYPEKLASLDLDLAIAPLQHNKFNEGKSNLRILEYGFMGWPVIASDIFPYQNNPVSLVANNPRSWIRAIKEQIHERETLAKEGDTLRQWVLDNWMLEDHLEEWLHGLLSDTCFKALQTKLQKQEQH